MEPNPSEAIPVHDCTQEQNSSPYIFFQHLTMQMIVQVINMRQKVNLNAISSHKINTIFFKLLNMHAC